MIYKFKKGDFVKNIETNDKRNGYVGIVEEEDDFPYVYWEDGEKIPYDEDNLEYNKFHSGDIVTINDKCRETTFDFIRCDEYTDNHLYRVDYTERDGDICIINGLKINSICLKLVSSQVRRMTIDEISKELGYEVEIIKEE